MNKNARIFIAGHRGMVGSAVHRKLISEGYGNLIFRRSSELDLRDTHAVSRFFINEKPEYVFLCAARVGGILANHMRGAEFIYDNLMIQTNVIHASFLTSVTKLLFLGSSCIYPRLAEQPLQEHSLLSGKLEPTNEAYAIAKIAGIKMCEAYRRQYRCNFISLMPTNLYGPYDNYDLENAHVLPALIRKFYEAKLRDEPSVRVWGSGFPKREFLHVDDLADACLFLMRHYNDADIINVGSGVDLTIRDLATLVKETIGYRGDLLFDTSKPDGTPRKLLDVSRLAAMGWSARITLADGLQSVCQQYIAEREKSAATVAA